MEMERSFYDGAGGGENHICFDGNAQRVKILPAKLSGDFRFDPFVYSCFSSAHECISPSFPVLPADDISADDIKFARRDFYEELETEFRVDELCKY